MTASMSQVTCGFCHDKVDEIKWKEHLTSHIHLKFVKVSTLVSQKVFSR